jgi:NADH dehydrogenase (ubiquinone) Fe-S protein 1
LGNVGALEIGIPLYNPHLKNFSPKLVYILGCDDYLPDDIPKDAKVIYQGTHGDQGANRADLIFPGAAYVEKSATYVSTEGRVNTTRVACVPPYLAKEDWEIIRALSEVLGCSLPYDEVYDIRNRICELAPHLIKYDHLESHGFENLMVDLHSNGTINVNHNNLSDNIDNFYMTDSISRASPVMAKCSHAFNKKKLRNFKNLFVN